MIKHQYGNAITEDLWDAIGTASGAPVLDNMEQWIKHVGYPVLTVSEETHAANTIEVEQSRFITLGEDFNGHGLF